MPTINSSIPSEVDVRGPRFAAWITTVVLAIVLLTTAFDLRAATALIGLQALVFAIGAVGGPRRHPYGRVFAIMAPRLGPATEREPVPPLRFAQLVGFVFAGTAFVGFVAGAPVLGIVATAVALGAAFLNAAFGICLGCQVYPLIARLRPAPRPA